MFFLDVAESKQSKASPSLSKALEANDRSTDPTLSTLATSEDIDVTVVDEPSAKAVSFAEDKIMSKVTSAMELVGIERQSVDSAKDGKKSTSGAKKKILCHVAPSENMQELPLRPPQKCNSLGR